MDSELVKTDKAEVRFRAVEPIVTMQLFCTDDYRVWVMPLGVNLASGSYRWHVFTFLDPEWYDPEAPGCMTRFINRTPVEISIWDFQNGAKISAVAAFVLRQIEARVEAMNRDGVLTVMEDDPSYAGPLSIRGITLGADPNFAEKIYQGVQ